MTYHAELLQSIEAVSVNTGQVRMLEPSVYKFVREIHNGCEFQVVSGTAFGVKTGYLFFLEKNKAAILTRYLKG